MWMDGELENVSEQGKSKSGGSVGNSPIECDWLKSKVNNMFIKTEWLHMLVDRDENCYFIDVDQV